MKRVRIILILGACMILILGVCLFSMFLREEKEDTNKYSKTMRNKTCCEEGFFYTGNDQLIHFVSAVTKEDMIFCLDPVCEHEPASSKNKDPECVAAGCYSPWEMLYHDGSIYLFAKPEISEHEIYRLDIDSGTKELVAKLPFGCQILRAVFDKDYVYYMALTYTLSEGISGTKYSIDLVEVNLKDGSYRMITDFDSENTYSFDVSDRKMMAVQSGTRNIYYIDLDTLELDIIAEGDSSFEQLYSGICNSESYYYRNYNTNEVGIYNIITGEKQILFNAQFEEGINVKSVIAGYDKIYFSTYNDVEGFEYYLYDINDNITYNLTEKMGDYEVDTYDPYKSMFILKLKNEDGTTSYSVCKESELIVHE